MIFKLVVRKNSGGLITNGCETYIKICLFSYPNKAYTYQQNNLIEQSLLCKKIEAWEIKSSLHVSQAS